MNTENLNIEGSGLRRDVYNRAVAVTLLIHKLEALRPGGPALDDDGVVDKALAHQSIEATPEARAAMLSFLGTPGADAQ